MRIVSAKISTLATKEGDPIERENSPNINMFGFVAIDVESWFQKVKMEMK